MTKLAKLEIFQLALRLFTINLDLGTLKCQDLKIGIFLYQMVMSSYDS